MNAWLTLLTVGALLVPGVSFATCPADTWCTQPDSNLSGKKCSSIGPENTCYYDFSATTDPPCLSTDETRSISYWLEPDEDGASTGVTVYPYRCTENSLSTNHCTKILNDTTGDGIPNDLPLDGTTVLRIGREDVFVKPYICFDITANPSSDDARLIVGGH